MKMYDLEELMVAFCVKLKNQAFVFFVPHLLLQSVRINCTGKLQRGKEFEQALSQQHKSCGSLVRFDW